jgi:hypothetical protein
MNKHIDLYINQKNLNKFFLKFTHHMAPNVISHA